MATNTYDSYGTNRPYGSDVRDSTKSLSIVTTGTRVTKADKLETSKQFENNIKFIKKALKLTDKQTADLKVNELPEKFEEAQKKITVGDMQDLFNEDKPKISLTERLLGSLSDSVGSFLRKLR